ncbi:MAG: zinc-ribbon domain-containing protein, partial [Pyrinomonadaceae bacterium]
MFCPRCAAQNVDDASFCRACGTNISLVPQALTGRFSEAEGL